MTAASNYLENKLIDQIFRNQAFSFPTTLYIGLLTAAPSDTGGGTEVTGGNYARASVACSLANWAGTQAAGSTVASTGTGGVTSNNGVVSFNTPNANWGTVTHFGIYDAASVGNLLFWGPLSSSKAVFSGDEVSIQAGQLQIQIDD
jgi:hypothetical protein